MRRLLEDQILAFGMNLDYDIAITWDINEKHANELLSLVISPPPAAVP